MNSSKCVAEYDEEYWRDWFKDFLEQPNTIFEESTTNRKPEFTPSHNLCCDKMWFKCECVEALDWGMSYDSLPAEWKQDAYTYETPCSGCAFYYTENCIPFRKWLKDTITSNTFQGSIDDICDQYIPYMNYEEINTIYKDADCEF